MMGPMRKTAKQVAPWANSQSKKAVRDFLAAMPEWTKLTAGTSASSTGATASSGKLSEEIAANMGANLNDDPKSSQREGTREKNKTRRVLLLRRILSSQISQISDLGSGLPSFLVRSGFGSFELRARDFYCFSPSTAANLQSTAATLQ